MELKQYWSLTWRWAWLLVLGLIFGAGGGYLASKNQTPVYQANTSMLVVLAFQNRASDFTVTGDVLLIETYVQLLKTDKVIKAASERLNVPISAEQISVELIQDSQIIWVTVEDVDPNRAASIANMLVEVLIEQNETLQAGRYAASEANLQSQITKVEGQIATLQSQIDQITEQNLQGELASVEAQIASLQSEVTPLKLEIEQLSSGWTPQQKALLVEKQTRLAEIEPILTLYQQIYSNLLVVGKASGSEIEGSISWLQKNLDLYQQIYLQLLGNLESVRLARLQNTPNLSQIDLASVPEYPVRPRPMRDAMLAGAVGLIISIGTVFLIEYLDDTLKTPEVIERILGVPVIGFIAEMKNLDDGKDGPYVAKYPRSPVAEAFRSLRTNLDFAGVDKPLKILLITSTGPKEGKSTVAANLASVIAQEGKQVLMLDADLRRPAIHHFFDIPNQVGLSDLFRESLSIQEVSQSWDGVKGLSIITSGKLPPNPTDLLGSEKMGQVLSDIKNMQDVVVIDSPPSLVADAMVLAARVDGVLLVVQPGYTRADVAKATIEQFKRAGTRVVGVVLNRIPRNRGYYYGGYRYYSPYYYQGYHYYSKDGSKSGEGETNAVEKGARRRSLFGRLASRSNKPRDQASVESHQENRN